MNYASFLLSLSCLYSSIAAAQSSKEINVSNFFGFYRTSISGGPQIQILSPLGFQIGYAFHFFYTSSFFSNYNVLSSGKSVILQGINAGYEYSFWGGKGGTQSIQRNTSVTVKFPQRVAAFSALAFRSSNLKGIVIPSKSILRPTVPERGMFYGLDTGVNFDQSLTERLKISARASVLIPKFIGQAKQDGLLVSIALGLGTSL
jgi:hypothetical protein